MKRFFLNLNHLPYPLAKDMMNILTSTKSQVEQVEAATELKLRAKRGFQAVEQELGMITQKTKCFDLFQKAKVDNKMMFEKQNHKTVIQYKVKKNQRLKLKQKIEILVALRVFRGFALIQLLLKLTELTNELFVIEIETGNEVFIPRMISQDQYPMSFHYYDPI